MTTPLVITGFEPSGGASLFSQGWSLWQQQVFNKLPAGSDAFATYQDASIPALFGIDFFPVMNVGQYYDQFKSKATVLYIGIWRNPPSNFGTGIDYVRIITVSKS